jgi:hypothetical protein
MSSIRSSGRSRSKVVTVAQLQAVSAGLGQVFAKKTLLINGQTYKAEQLQQMLQNQVKAMQQVAATLAAWKDALAAERDGAVTIAEIVSGIHSYVVGMYGTSSTDLQAFGFAPRRKGQPTVETKAQAAAQNRATRKARNTMGSRQRLAVTGVVPSSNPPSVTQPEPSASAPAAPATPTSNGAGSTH